MRGELRVELAQLAPEARFLQRERHLLAAHRGERVHALRLERALALAQPRGHHGADILPLVRRSRIAEDHEGRIALDDGAFARMHRFDDARLLREDLHHALRRREHAGDARLARVFAEPEEGRERDREDHRQGREEAEREGPDQHHAPEPRIGARIFQLAAK